MTVELKPCPFCGAPAKIISCMAIWEPGGYPPDGRRITCEALDCYGVGKPFYGEGMEDHAAEWWNRRPLAYEAAKPAPAGGDWSYAFDSDTLRDRFGSSFMATEPEANGNVAVLMSQADAHAIIAALSAPIPAPAQGEAVLLRQLYDWIGRLPAGTFAASKMQQLVLNAINAAPPAPALSAEMVEIIKALKDVAEHYVISVYAQSVCNRAIAALSPATASVGEE